jgi:hypothetical protein
MKLTSVIVSGITLFACGYAGAAVEMPETGASMTFNLVSTAGSGVFSGLPTTFVFDQGGTQNGVTHLVIGPMSGSPTGDNAYVAFYSAVNASTGVAASNGIMKLKLSANVAQVNRTQVVGVIPLTNGWGNTGITLTKSDGSFDGDKASVAYNKALGVMAVTIGDAVSYIPYVATNESTVVFEAPFWISDGKNTTKFGDGYAVEQSDGSYVGTIAASDGSATYAVTIADPNDADKDGVADLTDSEGYWYSDCYYSKGTEYSSWFGWFSFYYKPTEVTDLTDNVLRSHSSIWHYEHGFLFTFTKLQDGFAWLYIYDGSLGWLATNQKLYPYIYAFDVVLDGTDYGPGWLYYKTGSGSSGKRYFYAFDGAMNAASNMGSASDGFSGWWSFPGANK